MKIVAITPDRKKDMLAAGIIHGLNTLGHEIIASDPGNNVINHYSEDYVVENSKDADVIIVFWGKIRGNHRSPKYHLLDKINRPDVTAYVDGSEWTMTGYSDTGSETVAVDWTDPPGQRVSRQLAEAKTDPARHRGSPWINEKMFNYAKWYFKRECYPKDLKMGIIPLNLCAFPEYFNNSHLDIKKDIDLFCSFAHDRTGLRSEVIKICKRLKDEGYVVKILGVGGEKTVDFSTYQNLISRSHIGISAWGGGNSCMRLFEIMAAKTCCLAQSMNIKFINGPEDGKTFLTYSSGEEFYKKFIKNIANKKACREIGEAGFDLIKNRHTCKSRAKYMLDIIGRK